MSAIILSAVHAVRSRTDVASYVSTPKEPPATSSSSIATAKPLVLLFLTGLTSMGMEVVWIRQFTPYLGTVVYAFAPVLGTYPVSTFPGLQVYRLWSKKNRREGTLIHHRSQRITTRPELKDVPERFVKNAMGLDSFQRRASRQKGRGTVSAVPLLRARVAIPGHVGTGLRPVQAERSSAVVFEGSRGQGYSRLIKAATYPAPNPLSIFTTLTLDAQEFIIPKSAASPLNAAP